MPVERGRIGVEACTQSLAHELVLALSHQMVKPSEVEVVFGDALFEGPREHLHARVILHQLGVVPRSQTEPIGICTAGEQSRRDASLDLGLLGGLTARDQRRGELIIFTIDVDACVEQRHHPGFDRVFDVVVQQRAAIVVDHLEIGPGSAERPQGVDAPFDAVIAIGPAQRVATIREIREIEVACAEQDTQEFGIVITKYGGEPRLARLVVRVAIRSGDAELQHPLRLVFPGERERVAVVAIDRVDVRPSLAQKLGDLSFAGLHGTQEPRAPGPVASLERKSIVEPLD